MEVSYLSFVQIAVAATSDEHGDGETFIYGLDKDGRVWFYEPGVRMPDDSGWTPLSMKERK